MTEKTVSNTAPDQNVCPIRIIELRCKSCAKCVRVCPAGVLSMKPCPFSLYGSSISVDHPELCIGCNKCENACPDIAIYVVDKTLFSYPKLSKEARERQMKILENDCQSLPEGK